MTVVIKNSIRFLCLLVFVTSCVEEIELQDGTDDYESLLVVNATITNQLQKQQISLSKTALLKSDTLFLPEENATVLIKESSGVTHMFYESTPGIYKSDNEFKAVSDNNYKLEIVRSNGREYASEVVNLPPVAYIDNLYPEVSVNDQLKEGVSVFLDIEDSSTEAKFYRIEFEETYKIVSPSYSTTELIPNDVAFPILYDDIPFDLWNTQEVLDFLVTRRLKNVQNQVCYNTKQSTEIHLITSEGLDDADLKKNPIRFIAKDTSIIRHRYSIKARLFVHSRDAYQFYSTLKKFSSSESTLSENQTGFFGGNVFSTSHSSEKVVGFFDVSAMDEKRLFFNYEEVFPGETKPSHFIRCDEFYTPGLLVEDFAHNLISSPLLDALNSDQVFFDDDELFVPNGSPFTGSGPFMLVLRPCGDCTVYGENSPPDFWVD